MGWCALAASLGLVGCPQAPGDGSWDRQWPDDDDDDLPDGEDPQRRGTLGLWYWEFPDKQTGEFRRGAMFSASFEDVLDAGQPGTGGVVHEPPDGDDACARTVWTAAEAEVTGGVAPTVQRLEAGPLTVTSPTWSVAAPWQADEARYYLELNPDLTMHTGVEYALTATGGGFPAFEQPTVLHVPAALTLTSPATDESWVLPDGDFPFTWVGGSEERVWIELHTDEARDQGNVLVACNAWNDGAFTIPAALLDAFPPGAAVRLHVHQPVSTTFAVGDAVVDVGSTASAQTLGAAPD